MAYSPDFSTANELNSTVLKIIEPNDDQLRYDKFKTERKSIDNELGEYLLVCEVKVQIYHTFHELNNQKNYFCNFGANNIFA